MGAKLSDDEVKAVIRSGMCPLIWRIAMSPHVPISLDEALQLDIRHLFQAEVLVILGDRAQHRATMDNLHRQALGRIR